VNQEYDKRGNRTRYDKNVQGSAGDYGNQYDLSYTFDSSSMLTAISDANSGSAYLRSGCGPAYLRSGCGPA